MRIFRNVTQLETVSKEKSHWAFAMYGCSDKVIGLLYLCGTLIVPVYPMCKLHVMLRTGDFWSIIGNDACFTYVRQDVQLIQR